MSHTDLKPRPEGTDLIEDDRPNHGPSVELDQTVKQGGCEEEAPVLAEVPSDPDVTLSVFIPVHRHGSETSLYHESELGLGFQSRRASSPEIGLVSASVCCLLL
jgi:hypothetical protein